VNAVGAMVDMIVLKIDQRVTVIDMCVSCVAKKQSACEGIILDYLAIQSSAIVSVSSATVDMHAEVIGVGGIDKVKIANDLLHRDLQAMHDLLISATDRLKQIIDKTK
jgi:hypothetical protein